MMYDDVWYTETCFVWYHHVVCFSHDQNDQPLWSSANLSNAFAVLCGTLCTQALNPSLASDLNITVNETIQKTENIDISKYPIYIYKDINMK